MYLLFLVKLYVVYNGSNFGYKTSFLFIVGLVSVLLCISNCIVVKVYTEIDLFYYDNLSPAMHCNPWYPLAVYFIVCINDIFMALFFLYSFVNPIRMLIKEQSSETDPILIHTRDIVIRWALN